MANTSAPKGKNPGTGTSAEADRTGVLRCLWADRFGIDACPAPHIRWCCLTDDGLWEPWGDIEQGRLFPE